jgi:hypothetical protein
MQSLTGAARQSKVSGRTEQIPHAGNGQIRVLSKKGNLYAAPTLVYHCVTQHGYRPPKEFIEAVVAPHGVGTDYGWFENPR